MGGLLTRTADYRVCADDSDGFIKLPPSNVNFAAAPGSSMVPRPPVSDLFCCERKTFSIFSSDRPNAALL